MVATPLGMHRVTWKQANDILIKRNYAPNQKGFIRWWIRAFKNAVMRFDTGLEQIESSWCPLNHFEEREGVTFPKHHEKFFGHHQIEEMLELLSTVGTVSDRKPKY
jgi:CRISPR/Cas system CMR-associated protein Cmr1 (group 7 of RAMP superfamily)